MSLQEALQTLATAIVADCSETLNDDYNFYRRRQNDGCNCYSLLHAATKASAATAENLLMQIEKATAVKKCRHRWTRSRIDEAVWVLIDAKAATAAVAQ